MSSIPLLFWIALLAAIGAVVAVVRWVAITSQRTAARILADFNKAFPGKCPLCSYHRHAARDGVDFPLGPHLCIEGTSPPHPLPTAKAEKWTTLV